jgi:hypothetical protein
VGVTPDDFPGVRSEEGTIYDDEGIAATAEGEQRYASSRWSFYDVDGEFDIRKHEARRQLVHLADGVGGPMESFATAAFRETLPAADPFPTSIIWYESAAKLKKIVEKLITYTGAFPTTIVWKVYDTDGSTVLATVTDTIAYSGPFETSRTRAIA